MGDILSIVIALSIVALAIGAYLLYNKSNNSCESQEDAAGESPRDDFCESPEVRGGKNYPIIVSCNCAPPFYYPYARGDYEYKCPSGKHVPTQFSKYAGWSRAPLTSCDLSPSPHHSPACK